MAEAGNVAARLAQGRPAVEHTADYVWACHLLGYQHSDLTLHPAQVYDWYDSEDGLDLRVLDDDCLKLRAAARMTDEALTVQRAQLTAFAAAWTGPGAESAMRFVRRHCDAGEAVAARLRAAAEGCAMLRDRLWQLIDGKVALAVDVDDRRATERPAWLAAAQTVICGTADRKVADELVDHRIKPYVHTDICLDWLTGMRSTLASVSACYDAVADALRAVPAAQFEIPGELACSPPDEPRAPIAPWPAAPVRPAAAAAPPLAEPVPAPSEPAPPPAEPAPGLATSPPAAPPASALDGLLSPSPLGVGGPLGGGGGLSGGAGDLGAGGLTSSIGGVIGKIVDGIGGLLGSLADGLAGPSDPDDPPFDDPADDDDLDDAADEEPDEHPDQQPDAEPGDRGEGAESAAGDAPDQSPPPAQDVIEAPPVQEPPAGPADAPPATEPPAGAPPPLPAEPAPPAPEEATPCEIAADELPQAGQ